VSPLTTPAPDDTGTDTFARFRYQARVAFPFCIACALGRGVRSVVCEHIEDILIETDEGWRFLQVKTRDESRQPWRLSHLTGSGGGLHSLLRTHGAIGAVRASLELHLEGSLARDDERLQELTAPGGPRSASLIERVAPALRMSPADCAAFLARVRVFTAPTRAAVAGANERIIGGVQPTLTFATARLLHEQVTDLVCRAMSAELIGADWLAVATGQAPAGDDVRRRVEAKRLTPESLDLCRRHLTPLPTPGLLQRPAGTSAPLESNLTRKLRAANASDSLVTQAHALRAKAALQEVALLSKSLVPGDEYLEDAQTRLLMLATPIADMHRGTGQAAVVYHEIFREIRQDPSVLDPHRLFNADPFALMGEVCQLSDGCLCDWG
jgi:hypothetical protein